MENSNRNHFKPMKRFEKASKGKVKIKEKNNFISEKGEKIPSERYSSPYVF